VDTKEIALPAAIGPTYNLRTAKSISEEQFKYFTTERLVERIKPIDVVIPRNKMKIFLTPKKSTKKSIQHVASLKNDVELLSRM